MVRIKYSSTLDRYKERRERLKEDRDRDIVSSIPLNIFSDRNVAVLEAISMHLKEKGYTFHQIAENLNRDDRTIWTAYTRAKKKHKTLIPKTKTTQEIPLSELKNRNLSIFEAIVVFLKEKKELTYAQIASSTARNDRTIWTVYSRAKKKRGGING